MKWQKLGSNIWFNLSHGEGHSLHQTVLSQTKRNMWHPKQCNIQLELLQINVHIVKWVDEYWWMGITSLLVIYWLNCWGFVTFSTDWLTKKDECPSRAPKNKIPAGVWMHWMNSEWTHLIKMSLPHLINNIYSYITRNIFSIFSPVVAPIQIKISANK